MPTWPPEDIRLINEVVRRDIETNLGQWFKPDETLGGISFDELAHGRDNEPLRNGTASAVVWTLHARHSGIFENIAPDGREVVIPGVTVLVSHPSGKPALRRFIDWHFVFAQLGSLPGRALESDNIIRSDDPSAMYDIKQR
jgi:hypothetical protein